MKILKKEGGVISAQGQDVRISCLGRMASEKIMKPCSIINVVLVIMLVVGISVSVVGCKDSPTKIAVATPTPTPPPAGPTTLLNTTVALDGNASCSPNFNSFCAAVYFTPTVGKVINIRATGPSNMDMDLYVYFPNGSLAGSALGSTLGSETMSPFVATVSGQYRLIVRNYSGITGTVSVVVTEN